MAQNNTEETVICYAPTMITAGGLWQADNPLDYSLPLVILQVVVVAVTTRLLVFLLKPFRQPRVVSEILGGVLLGPSVLGLSPTFANTIFPLRSVMVLETLANIGLIYFLFLVGVEMDITVLRKSGKKSMSIAAGGMILPFIVGTVFSLMVNHQMEQHSFIILLGISLSITAFPVLARILAELKLINTELGKIAMSAALVSDMSAWILLTLALSLTDGHSSKLASLWIIFSSVGYICFCIFVVRPLIERMIRKTPEGENFSEFQLCVILTGVMVSACVTNAIGIHSVLGAFLFGLVIPNGPLGITLIEKLEDFVSGLLLPLFFAISGLKTNIRLLYGLQTWGILIVIIALALAGKVVGTLLVCIFYGMPIHEGTTLGLLMNTKGLVEMIILNLGKDQKIIDERSFTFMVVITVIMTGVITPIVTVVYKPARSFIPYKQRTIQSSNKDAEVRVMVCIHTPRNVPTIINLLEASHPTKKSPICIYVLHLVELTGRATAMLIVHNNRKDGKSALNRTQAQSDHIINAFENFEQHIGYISVQPLTAVSPYETMHEDICNLAEDKRVAFIIIPFHKQQTVDGGMETPNPALRIINQNVLANAPCSVGILVDRGLNGLTRWYNNKITHHFAILFSGGPDDREALSYAWRMLEHPGICLTVMRFVPGSDVVIDLAVETGAVRDRERDEKMIEDFRSRTVDNESIVYKETVVRNGEETLAAVRSMDTEYDLFIVGRGQGVASPVTAGLTDWSECPELGPIGDILASSDFAITVSVLVVHQYLEPEKPELDTPDRPEYLNDDQPPRERPVFSP